MPESKPQAVQFGNQPPKDAEVQFGKVPESDETVSTVVGESDPTLIGVVPVYAGGDPVPASATDDDDDDDGADDGGATD